MNPEQRIHGFFPVLSAFVAGICFGAWQGSIMAGVFIITLLWTVIDLVDDAVNRM